ncbi:hypothetical protein [Pyrodictium abyssi]
MSNNPGTEGSDTGYAAIEALVKLERLVGERYGDVVESVRQRCQRG